MTKQAEAQTQVEQADAQLLTRRLMQITNLLICAFAFASIQYSLAKSWNYSAILFISIFLLLICQWLNRKGSIQLANLMLIIVSLGLTFLFVWKAEGLFDEIVVALPVLLVMAGLFTSKRHFFSILIAILLFLGLVYYAGQSGWRQDQPYSHGASRLLNLELILLVCGIMIWIVINDAQNSLKRLKEQIYAHHESEKKLTYLSRHDELTGLPNRVFGRALLEKAVLDAGANGKNLALLFIDLDHFKIINDSLGHLAGDRFLIQMAERLNLVLHPGDIVCRLGGDEFLIGIADAADLSKITTTARQLSASIAAPLLDVEAEVIASCSIGIAIFPKDGNDLETLLSHADMAMYAAKEMGRNTFLFFDESLTIRAQQNLKLISALRTAQVKNEFELVYQPVFKLISREIIGAEALIRWNHPELGLLMPADFIPAAEKSGLILEMGEWAINQACREMVQWQAAGVAPAVLAVNLSPVQFRRRNLTEVVHKALSNSGLAPNCLELELTESTAIEDAQRFIDTLQELKTLGVKIAIDDFGTGYSNLSYLQRFSVDKLKIDQFFVQRLQNGRQDQAIVTAIIQLAKSLNLTTVAEGIEDGATFRHLIDLQCDYGQGYWLAKPQSAEEFLALLKSKVV